MVATLASLGYMEHIHVLTLTVAYLIAIYGLHPMQIPCFTLIYYDICIGLAENSKYLPVCVVCVRACVRVCVRGSMKACMFVCICLCGKS